MNLWPSVTHSIFVEDQDIPKGSLRKDSMGSKGSRPNVQLQDIPSM